MSKGRIQFPERLGLLGLLGLVGVIGYIIGYEALQPWLAGFAAFSLIGLRFFREQKIEFPARLGLLGFWGFLGFLSFIPGFEILKVLHLLYGFYFFFVFLDKS